MNFVREREREVDGFGEESGEKREKDMRNESRVL